MITDNGNRDLDLAPRLIGFGGVMPSGGPCLRSWQCWWSACTPTASCGPRLPFPRNRPPRARIYPCRLGRWPAEQIHAVRLSPDPPGATSLRKGNVRCRSPVPLR